MSQFETIFIKDTKNTKHSLLVRVGEVLLEVFGHTEALDLLISEDGGHGSIGSEPLLVLGVLEFLLLQIGPESLHTLQREI